MVLTQAYKKISALNKRIKVVSGGAGAGKTFSILQHLIILASRNDDEVNGVVSCVSESMPHLRRGVFRDFVNILTEAGIYCPECMNKTNLTYQLNNTLFEFFSAEDESKLRGSRRRALYLNESNNLSEDAFTALEIRTSGSVYMDFNPVSKFWAMDLPEEARDYITLTHRDNAMLSPNERAAIESRKGNEQWYRVYGLGLVGEVEGVILKNWEVIKEVPPDAEIICAGLDFGFSNDPTSCTLLYRYNGEIILDQIIHSTGLSNKSIADIFLNLGREYNICYCDSAEPKSIAEIRSYGVRVLPATKGQDSVRAGLEVLQNYRLRPTESSLELIKALRNYSWQRDKTGVWLNTPNHAWSDAIDAIRYAGVMSLTNKKLNSKYVII